MQPLDLSRLKVFPLSERHSLTRVEDILVEPSSTPKQTPPAVSASIEVAAEAIRKARAKNASVMLIYGAHLLRNGAALILERMMAHGWLTHLATNGAGTIHDWEYAWFGRLDRERRDERRQRHVRHLARDGDEHPPGAAGRCARTGWATAARSAGSSSRTA